MISRSRLNPARNLVNVRLQNIRQRRERAVHVAVKSAIADRHLRLVPVVKTSAPNLFDSAINVTPRSRDCTFSSASFGLRSGKNFFSCFSTELKPAQSAELRSGFKIFRKRGSVAQTAFARISRRHRHAQNIFRAERIRRKHGHKRRINSSRQTDDDRFEAAFIDVISNPKRQRENLRLARRESILASGFWLLASGCNSATKISSSNPFPSATTSPCELSAALWPSKINSSFAPTRLTCASGIFSSRATRRSISSRIFSLPSCHGDAEMFKIISAPCEMSSFAGVASVNPLRPEILVVPDVLANRDAILVERASCHLTGWKPVPTKTNGATVLAGSKYVFVKNVVSRQQRFVRAPDDFFRSVKRGGIPQRAPGLFGMRST